MTKKENGSYRVLVVGCGQLGSRHLQAVASLPTVTQIDIVEPNLKAIETAKRFLSEVSPLPHHIRFNWHQDLQEASREGDLCILATQARNRFELLEQIATRLAYPSFLIEKIVAQSVKEYKDMLGLAKLQNLSIWVNCKTRAYPIHKRIKKFLDPQSPIIFTSVGGNHGLANNGVHTADIFMFHDGCNAIRSTGVYIDPILHPSKRGSEILDLSGTLQGVTPKGSQFSISFAKDHALSEQITIVSKDYRCIVDHMQRWALESSPETKWLWKPVPFEGNLMVSEMTKAFASDILNHGRCDLPTLEDCFLPHAFILETLQPHFNKLMGKDLNYCPVT